MTDTVNTVEFEDVLSSIRRLVAEGDRSRGAVRSPSQAAGLRGAGAGAGRAVEATAGGAGGGAGGAADGVAASAERDRFVLTPALRVAGGERQDDESAHTSGDTSGPGKDDGETGGIATVPDDHAAAVARDEAPFIDTDAAEEAASAAGAPCDRIAPLGRAGRPAVPRDFSRLEATIAELEAAVTGQPDEWEPDGTEEGPVMGWHAVPGVLPFAPLQPGSVQPIPFARAGGRPAAVTGEAALTFQHRRTLQVEAARAAPRTGAGDAAAADEGAVAAPVASGDAPSAPPQTLAQSDAPADAPVAAASGQVSEVPGATGVSRQDDPAPDATDPAPRGPLPDAAALRALIAEVVREELRGTLGEDVTRNLRKMVRREIYRVLATQNLD